MDSHVTVATCSTPPYIQHIQCDLVIVSTSVKYILLVNEYITQSLLHLHYVNQY